MTTANFVRRAREELDLTQEELAKKLGLERGDHPLRAGRQPAGGGTNGDHASAGTKKALSASPGPVTGR